MTDSAETRARPRILCVDDEENILKAIQRSLRKNFEIHIAGSGREGLEVLKKEGPFHVVISDMKMPQMNGATFLNHAHKIAPDTVRMLLTGFAEFDTVVAAINEGHIFRFMAKPVSAGDLLKAIEAAVAQYRLQTAEQELLEKTLKGSVQALTEVLALANPEAFGRATRIRTLVAGLADEMGAPNNWQAEMAAMLSQIGTVTLPNDTAVKVYRGSELTEREKAMVARIPEVNREVLQKIPRLDPILEIFAYMGKNYDGSGTPKNKIAGGEIPLGARLLRVAMRVEQLQNIGYAPSRILDDMRAHAGVYDPHVLDKVENVIDMSGSDTTVRGVSLLELRTGMILKEEVRATNGLLLVGAGQEVTVSLLERIQNYNDTVGLQLPMWIEVPQGEIPEGEVTDPVTGEGDPAEEPDFNFS